MKKIIMVLVIFISSIIFYDSYVNLSQKQYNDVINLSYKFAQENDMEVIPIDLKLSEDKQERTKQFNQVYSFLQEHSYPCFVGIVSKNIKTKYVYLPKQNKLPIYTEENKTIDFTKNSNHYLSSSYKDKNRYATIDFIDQDYHSEYNEVHRIKTFANYIEDWNGNTLFPLYFVTNSKQDLLKDLEDTKILSELKVDGDITTSDFSTGVIDYSFLKRILMYLAIAVLLCLLSDALTSRKEVFIRKMQGATSWFIYKRLYGKFYLLSILMFVLTQALLYLLVVQNFRPVTHELIQYLLQSALLFVLCLIVVGFIIYVLLSQIQSVVILKKSQFRWISMTLFILKCVFLISIFIPLLTSFKYTSQVVQDGYYLNKYKETYNNYLRLEGVNINMFSLEFQDAMSQLNEKIREYPYIYEDFSTKINRDEDEITYPYIIVNEQYLKEYDLYKDGKPVKTFKPGTLYAPKSVNVDESYCLATECEYDQLDDGYVMLSHSLREDNWHVKNPIIYVVDENYDMSQFGIFIKDKDKTVKKSINDFLKSKGLYQNVNYAYENYDYGQNVMVINKLIIDSAILLFVYVIVLFLFQYQSIYLYFLENRKMISLNCLLGKNIWQKYRDFIIVNLFVYLVLLLWMVLVVKNISTIGLYLWIFTILIDFMIALIFRTYFERKKVLLSLKGRFGMKVVVVDKIHKQYHDHVIFDDFSMEIEQGSFVAIQGASGSGKSTLLNMIGLLDSPDKGNIAIFDKKNVKPFSRQANKLLKAKIGYLFQNFALIDNKSVYYNLYLSIDHFSFPDKKERILKALEDVGLKGFENKKICECSGGEQQRVALARLLIKPCQLILADEPTGSLDSVNKEVVFKILKKMQSQGKTIVIVSHDEELVERADRIINI